MAFSNKCLRTTTPCFTKPKEDVVVEELAENCFVSIAEDDDDDDDDGCGVSKEEGALKKEEPEPVEEIESRFRRGDKGEEGDLTGCTGLYRNKKR